MTWQQVNRMSHLMKMNPVPQKKQAQPLSDQQKEKSFELNKDDTSFAQLFPELGISKVEQINAIIVKVRKSIDISINQPELQTFHILIDKKTTPFEINIIKNNQNVTINLKCGRHLHQLLSQYLPELKKELKNKDIYFDDILLEMDTETEKKAQTTKNNI